MSKALLGFVVIVIIIIGGYFLLNNRPSAPTISPSPTIEVTPSPEETDLRLGGSSYRDPDGVFVLLYSNNYVMDTQNEGAQVRFIKRGETQRPQSEISDGALVVVEKFTLEGQTMSDWVDARIKQATTDESFQITQEKRATTINGQPAFTYTIRSLGESQTYVLQKDENSDNVVVVTTLVADPKNVGYQAEIDALLVTVEVLQ